MLIPEFKKNQPKDDFRNELKKTTENIMKYSDNLFVIKMKQIIENVTKFFDSLSSFVISEINVFQHDLKPINHNGGTLGRFLNDLDYNRYLHL